MRVKDLSNPKWIVAKGILFLLLGLLAATILFVEIPTLKSFVLLTIVIWSFCRFYYFAFYVLERYVDSDYRYSGLGSLMRYIFGKARGQERRR